MSQPNIHSVKVWRVICDECGVVAATVMDATRRDLKISEHLFAHRHGRRPTPNPPSPTREEQLEKALAALPLEWLERTKWQAEARAARALLRKETGT